MSTVKLKIQKIRGEKLTWYGEGFRACTAPSRFITEYLGPLARRSPAVAALDARTMDRRWSINGRSCFSQRIVTVLRLRQMFDPYIALMLATVAIAALIPAEGRGALVAGEAADAGIVFLFFLYGTRLSLSQARDGFRQWRLQLATLCCTFVLFPLLGFGMSIIAAAGLPSALVTGFLFLCVLPSTVQSSIAFTSIARGNVAAALCAASASNIIGVFVSPVLASWLLHTQGVQISFTVFRSIILQLLMPFLLGQLLRPWIGNWVQRQKRVLSYADRGSILLIIYAAFSQGMSDHVWHRIGGWDLLTLFAMLAVLLGVVLFLTGALARRIMRIGVADEIVLQFCGSKKSLASGLPMASVLFAGPQLGLIVLPLMLFHQLQLIVCAVLARRYGARREQQADIPDGADGNMGRAPDPGPARHELLN